MINETDNHFLIENYAGDFPLWLAPVQVRLLPVSEAQRDYANEVVKTLVSKGYRAEVDVSGARLGKQVRTAELEKIPVTAVIGQREVESQSLSIRTRQSGDLGALAVSDVIEKLQDAIAQKSTF